MRKARIGAILLSIVWAFQFLSAQNENPIRIRTALTVTSVSPARNVVTAQPTATISATFSNAVTPSTVTDSSVVVLGSLTGRHTGHASLDGTGTVVTFAPDVQFLYGEQVQVVLKSEITSPVGGALVGGYSWGFRTKTNYGTGVYHLASSPVLSTGIAASITSGDFNSDGYADLALVDSANNRIKVLFNNHHGGFYSPQVYQVGTAPDAIVAADVDGNHCMDLIVANWGSNSISVLRNDGTGSFLPAVSFATGSHPSALVAADDDNDGDIDITVTNAGDNSLVVLVNDGMGVFSTRQTVTVGSSPRGVAMADFNGDGLIDGAVTNQSSNSITILKNAGSSFSVDTTYVLPNALGPTCILSCDFDTSGTADLAVAFGGASEKYLAILLNAYSGLPLGRFNTSFPLIDIGTGFPSGLYGGDFNADARLDLAVSKSSPNVAVLLNYGIAAPGNTDVPAAAKSRSVMGIDFSGLGVVDLVVCGTDGKMRILRDSVTSGLSPNLSTSLSSVDFGTTKDSLSVNLVVYSSLLATRVDSVQVGSPFIINGGNLPKILIPYDSLSISLGFRPTAGIQYASTLRIYSSTSSPGTISIPVAGTGDPSLAVRRTNQNIPASFSLEQNYPNPFNPSTRIRYQLPVTSFVSLKVFDMLGREVAVLKEGVESAGWFSVQWHTDRYASGLYLYRLTALDLKSRLNIFESTRKMLLLK